MSTLNEAPSLVDWVTAGAAVVTVFAGFAYVSFERRAARAAAGRAAGHLARHSIDQVTDRLNALVDPDEPLEFALRGARATEMVEVFRELEISMLPPKLIASVAVIRSTVFAINARIDEVLTDEGSRRHERRKRLFSAGRTLITARTELDCLQRQFLPWDRPAFEAKALTTRMVRFIDDACLDCAESKPEIAQPPKLPSTATASTAALPPTN